jgi:hypothetical protein
VWRFKEKEPSDKEIKKNILDALVLKMARIQVYLPRILLVVRSNPEYQMPEGDKAEWRDKVSQMLADCFRWVTCPWPGCKKTGDEMVLNIESY